MTGKSKDLGEEGEDQQFTPTDWDWVMFLSGEINAIETRFDTVWTVFSAIVCAFTGFLIVFMGFLITCSNPDSIVDIIIRIAVIRITGAIIGVVVVCLFWQHNKYKHKAEDRVKLLERCRNDIFNRLDDPNKILECYLNPVGKKTMKTNR